MSSRRTAGWIYVAAAVACLAAYHSIGRGDRSWDALLWMYDPPVRYEIAPLVLISLLLAATRVGSAVRSSVEVVAAIAWCATVAAVGAWRFAFNTVDRMGASTIDALAALTALAALSMFSMAASGLVASRHLRLWLRVGQTLQGLASMVLGYFLFRTAIAAFLSTRVLPGGGIERFSHELRLRQELFLAAILLLSSAGVLIGIDRVPRAFARDEAVEQGDAPDEVPD